MGGPSGEDDITELTESMTTRTDRSSGVDTDSTSGSTETERSSQTPPRPSSPFVLLADTSKSATVDPPEGELPDSEPPAKRSSVPPRFTPSQGTVPVVTSPIRKLRSRPPEESGAEKAKASSDEGMTVVEKLDPDQTTDEDDDGIFDLSQEFVVHSEGEKAEEASKDEAEKTAGSPPALSEKPSEPPPATKSSKVTTAEASSGSSEGDKAATPSAVPPPVPPRAVEASHKSKPPKAEEELDLDGAEDLTPVEGVERDEEEELDLADAVEVPEPPKSRVSAPSPPPTAASASSTSAKAQKMRRRKGKKEWWAEVFNDDYLTLIPTLSPRDERKEIDFIERHLGVNQGSLVLDLACGNGRHAVGMAARGYRLVGVDLSLAMLARAGDLAQEAGQKINFIHGDMRDLGFDKTFDAVYCIGTSFGYFDEATNMRVLEGVYRALKPGGVFLLEVVNRDYAVNAQPNLTWFEGNGSVCMEETDFNYLSSRLHVTRQLIIAADSRQVKTEASIRLYCLHELGNLLHKAGFGVTTVEGHPSCQGAFFGVDSAKLIIVADRRRGG